MQAGGGGGKHFVLRSRLLGDSAARSVCLSAARGRYDKESDHTRSSEGQAANRRALNLNIMAAAVSLCAETASAAVAPVLLAHAAASTRCPQATAESWTCVCSSDRRWGHSKVFYKQGPRRTRDQTHAWYGCMEYHFATMFA